MITFVALTTGLVIWIALWAIGAKPLDAFLPTVILVVTAATVQIMLPAVRRFMGREEPASRG
jgi:hypothetical protein